MKSSVRRLLILIVLMLTTLPLTAQFGPGGGNRGGSGGLFAVVSPAKPGRVVTVGGRLIPQRKITHNIPVTGIIDSLLVKIGDRVTAGQPLVKITRDVVGETFRPVILESRISGVVSGINVFVSQEVNSGTAAVIILDDRSFLLETSLSDRDAQAVRALGPAVVSGTTPEGKSFPGNIRQLSQEPDYTTGLFTLTIEFPKKPGMFLGMVLCAGRSAKRTIPGMFLGMVLFADLPAQKAEGISVEKSAVIRADGKTFLWILDSQNQLTRRPVVTGGDNGINTYILEGVSAGDRYIRQPGGNEKEGLGLRELIQANLNSRPASGGN